MHVCICSFLVCCFIWFGFEQGSICLAAVCFDIACRLESISTDAQKVLSILHLFFIFERGERKKKEREFCVFVQSVVLHVQRDKVLSACGIVLAFLFFSLVCLCFMYFSSLFPGGKKHVLIPVVGISDSFCDIVERLRERFSILCINKFKIYWIFGLLSLSLLFICSLSVESDVQPVFGTRVCEYFFPLLSHFLLVYTIRFSVSLTDIGKEFRSARAALFASRVFDKFGVILISIFWGRGGVK